MTAPDMSTGTRAWLAAGRHEIISSHKIFVYERRGSGQATADSDTTVVLLHGFPTSCYDWRGVSERLPREWRVVAFDFLGFGLSDKPAAYGYSLFQQADLLAELLSQLRIASAHIVSHDMGTSIHCEILARQQQSRLGLQVRSSTFLNGSMLQWLAKITPLQEMLANNATLPQAIEFCRTALPGVYVNALRGLMQKPDMVTAADAQVMEDLLRYQQGHLRLPALSGYMRERYLHADRWLGALEAAAPVQIVWADSDLIAHAEMGRELARRCPQATYHELPGLGHFLLIEDPAAVAERVAQFVAGHCD